MKTRAFTSVLLLSSMVLLGACSTSDDNDNDNDNPSVVPNPPLGSTDSISYGYAFTRASDYSSAQIVRISLTDGNIIDGSYPATTSNFVITTDGESLYQIGRGENSLTKLDASDTASFDYQVSVLVDGAEQSNPESLAFLNSDMAYLTQYLADSVLIVDPTPDQPTSDSVITGSISLAAYNRGSGDTVDLPDMTNSVIVDNKLFVLLELLDGFAPANQGYLVVIDTRTNQEISTDMGVLPLQGIELQTVNPTALQYNEDTGLLYVLGRGNAYGNSTVPGDPYTGGIESIDPTTYQTNLLIDDGTAEENQGFFDNMLVISDTLGYLITQEGFNPDNSAISSLRTFNPSTGEISDPIVGTENLSITSLALGPDNHVWAGFQSNEPGFLRIDVATGEVAAERVATELIPAEIVFIDVERQ